MWEHYTLDNYILWCRKIYCINTIIITNFM